MITNKLNSRVFQVLLNLTLALTLLIGSAAFPARAHAASTITVAHNADNLSNDGLCSLREAITNANADAQPWVDCVTGSGNDTIRFGGNYTITLGSQLPAVTTAITINGNGAANSIIQANAAFNTATYRIFEVTDTGNLTLDNLTVQNGRCNGSCANDLTDGGGIFNVGTLTVTNSTVANNSATNLGGGIYTAGVGSSLTIINSTFSGNPSVVSDAGGSIANNGSIVTITNSAFSANFTNNAGGAIYNSGPLTITNSTFSGNTAYGNVGGAIFNYATLTITNSTFSGNSSSGNGDGINNWSSGTLNLYNTIIANSTSNSDCFNNGGTVTGANNLIEDATNACGLANGVNGNIIGSDPSLGLLTGSPAYFPLNTGSPAIDAGDDTVCAAAPVNNTSQNGVTRPQGAHCDIGSYELDNIAPTVTMSSATTDPTNTSPIPVTVQFSETVTDFLVTDITSTNGTVNNFSTVDGDIYTFNLIPSGQGLVTANIAAGVASDLAGNGNTAATQFSRTYDLVAPTVTMASLASDPTNSSPIPVTVQFSETVTGFLAGDILPSNGAVSNFAAVDGDTYTFNLIPSGQGLVTANIAAGMASDLAGNGNTAATQFSRTYDSVAPTVTMSSLAPDSTNTSPISVTVQFSETATGFLASDIIPGNGSVGNFVAVDGDTYTFDLTPSGQGPVTADIAAGVASDLAGNGNTIATQFSRTYTVTYNLFLPLVLR